MLNRLARVFSSFESHEVRYVVIGGGAAVLHRVPRATYDLDILIEASRENAEHLLAALSEAGFGTASLTNPEDILSHQITIFKDYVRLDVQTSTAGISFESAWQRRETMTIHGRQDLIASKRAAGREIDLRDAEILEGRRQAQPALSWETRTHGQTTSCPVGRSPPECRAAQSRRRARSPLRTPGEPPCAPS